MNRIILVLMVCLCGLFVVASSSNAATYVFGEDGANKDLTASLAGNSWSSSDSFVVAGNCYVDDDEILTINSGVKILFGGHRSTVTTIPEIEVKGTIILNGSSSLPVIFTNECDTTRGLFEGLYLNGSSTNEGTLSGSYAVFNYGGYSNGVVRLGTDATIDVSDCEFNKSGNNAIYISSTGSNTTIEKSLIFDNDAAGIANSGDGDGTGTFLVRSCRFEENEGNDIEVPQRLLHITIDGNFYPPRQFANNYVAIRLEPGSYTGLIRNNYIVGRNFNGRWGYEDGGIWIDEGVYCPDDLGERIKIYNNVFAGLDYSIAVDDLDYVEDGDSYLRLDIQHNVFVDNAMGDALWLEGYVSNSQDWPDTYIYLKYNIFGWNNTIDIKLVDAPNTVPLVPATNAFLDADNCTNVSIANCIVEETQGDVWQLADEVGANDDWGSYDFHIEWDGICNLIDVGPVDADLDEDGSPADCGCYSGIYGDEGIAYDVPDCQPGGINSGDYDVAATRFNNAFYIDLGPGNITQNLTLSKRDFYMFEDFEVPEDYEYEITPGTYFVAHGTDVNFIVSGGLDAAGTLANKISFVDGSCGNTSGYGGDGWSGIIVNSDGDDFKDFQYCRICGVGDNTPAIHFSETKNDDDLIWFYKGEVYENGQTGIKISSSYVYLSETDVNGNGGYGILIEDPEADNDVYISDCIIECSEEDGVYIVDGAWTILSGTAIIDCDKCGIFIEDADPNDVEIGNVYLECNSGEGNDAGVELQASEVDFDDYAGEQSSILGTNGPGVFCSLESTLDLNDGGTTANTKIQGNNEAAIFMCVDEFNDAAFPELTYGFNDLVPSQGKVSLFFQSEPVGNSYGAFNNWWGSDPPVLANVSNFPNNVFTTGHCTEPQVNDITEFDVAEALFNDESYAESIQHFENAIFEAEDFRTQRRCLKFLRAAYRRTDQDLEDLRDYYLEVAGEHENQRLVFETERQNVLTLDKMGDLEGMIDLLLIRRENLENRVDYLNNEIDLVRALHKQQRRANGYVIDNSRELDEEITRLRKLIRQAVADGKELLLIPAMIELTDVFPNPFNSTTRISYTMNGRVNADVSIFDVNGRLVEKLLNGVNESGTHSLIWNADNCGTGVYFVKLNASGETHTKMINLIK